MAKKHEVIKSMDHLPEWKEVVFSPSEVGDTVGVYMRHLKLEHLPTVGQPAMLVRIDGSRVYYQGRVIEVNKENRIVYVLILKEGNLNNEALTTE